MAYKLVIFDFDGTLADSAAWFLETLPALARRHGFRTVTDEEIEMLRGRPNREIVRYLRIPAWRMPFIAADLRRRMAADTGRLRLFDGADQLLLRLARQGSRVAIVSSNAKVNVRKILGPEAAAAVSDYECGAGLFGKAARFRRAIRRAGVQPFQTLCVGDELRDIEAAREVGADCAAVLWGYASPEALRRAEPDLVFESIAQVAERLCHAGPGDFPVSRDIRMG